MRWIRPEHGETRTVTRFLLIPLTIGKETRWLERATWEETWWDPWGVYVESMDADDGRMAVLIGSHYRSIANADCEWGDRRWIDDQ